jgi:hypothetical protein
LIEVKLHRKEIDPKTKETERDGVYDSIRVVLIGKDKTDDVDWTLTLKYKGKELPDEYKKALGERWYDEVKATLKAGVQQERL